MEVHRSLVEGAAARVSVWVGDRDRPSRGGDFGVLGCKGEGLVSKGTETRTNRRGKDKKVEFLQTGRSPSEGWLWGTEVGDS